MLIKACVILFWLLRAQIGALAEPFSFSAVEQPPLMAGFPLPAQDAVSPVRPLSHDPQSLLSVEISSTVAWGELSYSLAHAYHAQSFEGTSSGAIDLVNLVVTSVKEDRFMMQIIADAAYTPQASLKSYKFSRQALERLQKEGLPSDLIAELMGLEEQEFASEELFWQAVETQIGTADFQQYRQSIVTSAAFATGMMPPMEQPVVPVSWQTSLQIVESREAWNAVFYYPRVMRNTLAGTRPAATNRDLDILDEEEDWFDILKFFKRWGVPTPMTIALSGFVVYLILAFLTRSK